METQKTLFVRHSTFRLQFSESREYIIVFTFLSFAHDLSLCDAMTEEERQGNDKKEDDALEPYNSLCFAKLFRMKEKDTWEELFVGMCTVDKIVSVIRPI